jgi:hypothetical protein
MDKLVGFLPIAFILVVLYLLFSQDGEPVHVPQNQYEYDVQQQSAQDENFYQNSVRGE